jgi:Tfp pilus assembly protein PilF
MARKLIFILVLASLTAGCGQSRPVEQGTSGSRPDDAAAFLQRGNAYFEKGDWDKAIAEYDQAIQLWPGFADAYSNRGSTYHNKGDYDQAIADFDRAIQIKPDEAALYNKRGYAYYGKSDYDRAITDYDRAIQVQPDYDPAYSNRGLAYYGKGDYERAIVLQPDNAILYLVRSLVLTEQGRKTEGIADLKKCLELSSDPELRQAAQQALNELGAE